MSRSVLTKPPQKAKRRAAPKVEAFKPDPVMFKSLAAQVTRQLPKGFTVEMLHMPSADAYIVEAWSGAAYFTFKVTGLEIDSAGTAIVEMLRARILKALT